MLTSLAISCGSADPDAAAVADVRPLGALPHHHEVDLAGVRERARDVREQPGRTQVDVVVEREPQLEQQAALDDAAGQARVARVAADRAEQDRVVRRRGAARSSSERMSPVARKCSAPNGYSVVRMSTSPTVAARRTATASAITSGPMPSPAITAMSRGSLTRALLLDCQAVPRQAGNGPKTPASTGPVSLPVDPRDAVCPPFGGRRCSLGSAP